MVMKISGANKMSNLKKIVPNNICRICMTSSDIAKAVDCYELTPKICRMLKICTQINVEINDSLPQHVCNNCYYQLNEAFKFISLAKKSNNRLKKYSKNVINKSVSSLKSESSSNGLQDDIKQEEKIEDETNNKRETLRNRLNNVEKCKDTNSETNEIKTSLTNEIKTSLTNEIKTSLTNEIKTSLTNKINTRFTNSPEILLAVGLIQIKSNVKPKFKCDDCGQNFLWLEPYKRHLANKHKVFAFECRICGDKFSSRMKLQDHRRNVHSGKNPYRCIDCKTNFKTLDNLTIHIRKKHAGKSPFICKICKNGFQTKDKLQRHLHIHSQKSASYKQKKNDSKGFNCKNCDKKFKKNSDLIRHVRVHTGEKPFVCKVCKIGFQQAHNLTKHMVIHTKEKAFICDICNKQFGRNDSMMRHMLVHSIEKPYACTKCQKTFARHSQLEIHVKNNHSGDIDAKDEVVK